MAREIRASRDVDSRPGGEARLCRRASLWSVLAALGGAALATLAGSRPATSMEVSLRASQPLTWVGEPVILEVQVSNPERGAGEPEFAAASGISIRGPSGPMSTTQIVNGRRSSSLVYSYELTPTGEALGKIRVGPVRVARAGKAPVQSNVLDLHVYKKPPAGIRFTCTLIPAGGPVGAPFRAVYTVYYTGQPATRSDDDDFFPSIFSRSAPFGLTGLDLPLLKLSGVRVEPVRVLEEADASSLQLRMEDRAVQIPLQESFAADSEGFGYKTLVFGFQVVPMATGNLTIPPATVALQFQTGRTKIVRDGFFGGRRVAEVVDQKASTEAVTYAVRDLPREGRPPGFSGAIGKYTVEVKAAPLEVDEFEPINLEVRVKGQGILEDLNPPTWTEVDALAKDFQVSTDLDTGKIEGDSKVFKQVIRPKRSDVVQIPPVPFPYFNPVSGKYEVAYGEPIPIKVRKVETVRAEQAIPSARSASIPQPAAGAQSAAAAIVEQGGIGANFPDMGRPAPSLDPREEFLSVPFLAVVAGPPALYGLLLLAVRLRKRDPRRLARERALAAARAALSGPVVDSDAVSATFQEYFRRRLGLPSGELTPPDLARELERRGVHEKLRRRVQAHLEKLLAGRFGGGRESPSMVAEEALEILKEVDACTSA